MIKNLKKKAFTLVELLVVIAILAILATAGIVGYTSFTKKAQVSNDNSLVAELNNYISVASVTNDYNTVSEVRDELVNSGIDLSTLTPSAKNHGYYYAFNLKEEKFVLLHDKELAEGYSLAADTKSWDVFVLVKNADDAGAFMNAGYSVYLQNGFEAASLTASKGVDVGENTGITNISYSNAAAEQNVVIRTNGGTLTVNAPNDTIHHYGNLDTLTITAIKNSSYHETGSVVNVATLTAGRIVVENGGYIKEVELSSTATNATATVVVNGYVGTVDSSAIASEEDKVVATGSGYVADNNGTPMGTPASVETSISSLADLHQFRDRVNAGQDYSGLTIKLTANLDLTGVVWTPIGNSLHPFAGTFDGQNHTITGLTNAGYEGDENNVTFTTSTSAATGYAYGFFGIVGSLDNNNAAVTLKNMVFEGVAIDCPNSNMCAALVAADVGAAKIGSDYINPDYAGNITIENVTVSGELKAVDSVAGIAGKMYTKGAVSLNRCVNNANISNDIPTNIFASSNYKVAGVLAYRNLGTTSVTKCSNTGSISKAGKGFGATIANLGYKTIDGVFTHSENANSGTLSWKKADGSMDTTTKLKFFNYNEASNHIND